MYFKWKTEDLNLNVNFIFGSSKCYPDQKWNKDLCWCEWKNPRKNHVFEKDYV